jgi:hypothetical protein
MELMEQAKRWLDRTLPVSSAPTRTVATPAITHIVDHLRLCLRSCDSAYIVRFASLS